MRILSVFLTLTLVACQGGVIEQNTPDAAPQVPDASNVPNYLGQTCSIDLPCPSGWDCLTQPGGNGSWCTKACTTQSDPVCSNGYVGPGFGACILTPVEGSTPPLARACAVVCSDPAGAPEICPAGVTCNGTCAAPLLCAGVITDANQIAVGMSCQ
jgi:hypothetical protein